MASCGINSLVSSAIGCFGKSSILLGAKIEEPLENDAYECIITASFLISDFIEAVTGLEISKKTLLNWSAIAV
jgi:hypothetical protein